MFSILHWLACIILFTNVPKLNWKTCFKYDNMSDDFHFHADRYDRLLEYLHLADGWLRDLWVTLQADEHYRDRTTLIITTDHGRGQGPADWAEHDQTIPGSESIWVAVIGPDTPALGDAVPRGTVHQGAVAATILELFGIDPDEFDRDAAPPLPGVVGVAEGGR